MMLSKKNKTNNFIVVDSIKMNHWLNARKITTHIIAKDNKNLANKIKKHITTKVFVEESNDPRSYRQISDKLISTDFIPRFTVDDAIKEIIVLYNQNKLEEKDSYYNVKQMKKIKGLL